MPSLSVSDSTATIVGIPASTLTLSGTTNSSQVQRLTVTIAGASQVFEGAGERQEIANTSLAFDGSGPILVTCEYQGADGWKPSTLRTGGPYAIGKTNFVIITTENGDDSDFNDCVVQFKWR